MQFIETVYAAEEAHEAQAEAGVLGSLGINETLFVSQLINFAIVAMVLWFLILKPLTKKLAERQKMIDESIENSKKIQDNLATSEAQYQEKMDKAKVEAHKIIEKAANEAEEVSASLKSKAKVEIEGLVEQAKNTIKIERDEMRAAIRKEAAEMVVMAVEKILSEKMNDQKDKAIIAEMVGKLK